MGKVDHLWEQSDIGGPTEDGVDELHRILAGKSLLSCGEATLIKVVFDFWAGSGETSLWDMMNNLEPGVCRSIGELLMAISEDLPRAIDEWEESWSGYDPTKAFFDH